MLAANSSLSLTYQLVAAGILTGVITNSATITAVTPDPNLDNNSASINTTILRLNWLLPRRLTP